jgi:thymidylate synthase
MSTTSQFPIVDALLITPPEGKEGFIGICTNTSAPGQVLNEIEEPLRTYVSALGSLIVSRDGTERMILNSLAHPTITFLILFSEESLTFSPSTNLLLALQYGIDGKDKEHPIINGKAASAHYPNLSPKIVDAFQKEIIVLPMFMYKNDYSKDIVMSYLEWLKPKIPESIYTLLFEVNSKGKIYYDSLNKLVKLLSSEPVNKNKNLIELDPKEFQHLQPPKVEAAPIEFTPTVPFGVKRERDTIRLDLRLGEKTYFIKSADEFLLEYSLMKFLGEKKKLLTGEEQLFLGAEISRVNAEIKNNVSFPSFVKAESVVGTTEILLEPTVSLITDKKYYYKINVRDGLVLVMCLAFDVCEEVFELRSPSLPALFKVLSEKNRFENYEMDILHRIDVGGQVGRAAIAAKLGYAFIQDFPNIFKVNTETLPLLITESDSFFDVHKNTLLKLYTQGLTEEHGDKQKGLARSGVVLAIYRNTEKSLATLPTLYKQGERSTEEIRKAYKEQLLRFDHDGDYSYGERTRAFFGFDQLPQTIETLRRNPHKATIVQRYDPSRDMSSYIDEGSGKKKYTHDPCLTHDIFFMQGNTLHSFHIARAHNIVNAYPENIFGLYDAYVTTIREGLGATHGDMYI